MGSDHLALSLENLQEEIYRRKIGCIAEFHDLYPQWNFAMNE
jgi:hypothetical protein